MTDKEIIILDGKVKDLGGFSVNRVLPSSQCKMVGPWIFFDHAGPSEFSEGNGIDVRPHPHINLSTVIYLFEGEVFHRDSLGNKQIIKPGEINLMVSGRGIAHSERSPERFRKNKSRLHALQLWLALPNEFEEMEPEFHHYSKDSIPKVQIGEVEIRVLIGEAYGVKSSVKTFCQTLYLESYLCKNHRFSIPKAIEEVGIYAVSGSIKVDNEEIKKGQMIIIKNYSKEINIFANEKSQIAVIGGENIGKRYIEWNFVSSRKERIEKAKDDWKNQRFDGVIEDDEEYIPLPDDIK